jgi:adenosylhomocysteine nucleosidase
MSGAGSSAGSTKILAPAPEPADVGIVAALPIEVGPFLARLSAVRKYSNDRQTVIEGELGGKLIVMAITGTGQSRARKGAQLLLAGHRPSWLLSAGFGGALSKELRRNDVILAQEVMNAQGDKLAIDVTVNPDSAEPGPRLRPGKILTVDHIVRSAAEKAELNKRLGADVVDIETFAVASVCSQRGVRFLAVRVVSDDASVDLPREVVSILGRSGGYRLGAAVGAVWRRPGSLKDLWKLREDAVSAAEVLGRVIPGVIARLT